MPFLNRAAITIITLGATLLLGACQIPRYKEYAVSGPASLSSRLEELFEHTKMVCFGRYVLEVPQEARLIFGPYDMGSIWTVFPGKANQLKPLVDTYWKKLKETERNAWITHEKYNPSLPSLQIRWFDDLIAQRLDLEGNYTVVAAGPHAFAIKNGYAPSTGETRQQVYDELAQLARSVRAREPDEVPRVPGVCIDHGFVADSTYNFQEIFGAGIHLPSFPDVSFSVDSNKDAPVRDDSGNVMVQTLLKSIAEQKAMAGSHYPSITLLREGPRTVGTWIGEESLVRRKDGTHEFVWKAVGITGAVEHPAWIEAQMYTKVAANAIGAADAASLSDEEALALWDRLLDGLRFRPDGLKFSSQPPGTPPLTRPSGMPCPKTGRWVFALPPGVAHADYFAPRSIWVEQGQPMPKVGLSDPADEARVVWTWMDGERS